MPSAVVTSKGQITIPKPVREGLGVESGDQVEFVEIEAGVYTVVAATRDIRDLKGMIPKPAKPVSVEAMNRAVRRLAGRRWSGSTPTFPFAIWPRTTRSSPQ